MLVATTATSVRVILNVVDVALAPVTGLTDVTAGLEIKYWKPANTSWQSIPLVPGSATWTSGGFREFGGGIYELCVPNAAISSGESTVIKLDYDSNPTLFDTIEARLAPSSKVQVIDYEVPLVDEALSFEITQLDDYLDSSEVGAIGPIRVETTLDLTAVDSILFGATRTTGTSRYVVADHFEGTVTATPVGGMPDTYDLIIEIPSEELTVNPGTYEWDIEAVYDESSVENTRTFLSGTCTVKRSMGVHV